MAVSEMPGIGLRVHAPNMRGPIFPASRKCPLGVKLAGIARVRGNGKGHFTHPIRDTGVMPGAIPGKDGYWRSRRGMIGAEHSERRHEQDFSQMSSSHAVTYLCTFSSYNHDGQANRRTALRAGSVSKAEFVE